MSRPIPEGVNKPHPNAVILGWGGDFEVPKGGFDGYAIWPGLYPDWDKGYKQGDDNSLIYAADAGSEVARLNRDPLMDSVFGKDNCKGDKALGTECGSCERCKSYGWTQEDPRDGAIRELVQEWRESADDIERTGDPDNRYERGAIETLRGCADELEADLGKEKG